MATASELPSGSDLTNSEDGRSRSRVFRVLLSSPSESVNLESLCGISIGSLHPSDLQLVCTSYDSKRDGDSRVVLLVTFEYSVKQPESEQDKPPEQRLARWSTSASTWDRPVLRWRRREGVNAWAGAWAAAANPAGDIYDGVTTLSPLVKVTITQFVVNNPTANLKYVGHINNEIVALGVHRIQPHELILRNVNSAPALNDFAGIARSGWDVTYEFEWKARNTVTFRAGGVDIQADIGHDIAIVQSGWNVLAFDPAAPAADEDPLGQPLRHYPDSHEQAGRIIQPFQLPEGVAVGSRQRAQVAIPAVMGVGRQQAPSGQPIALNDDGRPRLVGPATMPIIKVYQVFESINLTATLGLRLA